MIQLYYLICCEVEGVRYLKRENPEAEFQKKATVTTKKVTVYHLLKGDDYR